MGLSAVILLKTGLKEASGLLLLPPGVKRRVFIWDGIIPGLTVF